MTVREFINILLKYEADEEIDFLFEDMQHPLTIKEVGRFSDLPFIVFTKGEK